MTRAVSRELREEEKKLQFSLVFSVAIVCCLLPCLLALTGTDGAKKAKSFPFFSASFLHPGAHSLNLILCWHSFKTVACLPVCLPGVSSIGRQMDREMEQLSV